MAGIYAQWNVDVDGDDTGDSPWHLGTDAQYPALSIDFDGAGGATWQEFGRQLRGGPTLTAMDTVGRNAVSMSWTAADASHWTPEPDITYTVTQDDGTAVTVVADAVSGTTATDTTVVSGGVYTYQVAATAGGAATHSAPRTLTVVGNRPPTAVGTLANRTLAVEDGSVDVDVAMPAVFSDLDNDVLTYGAVSSAPAVASVSVSGSTVTVTPLSGGMATITVTATDVGGSNTPAAQTFVVTVPNRSPVAVGTLADRSVQVSDGVFVVDVSGAFRDPDNDTLTYGASSSDTSVASATAMRSTVSVTPLSGGTAEITVTATDSGGLRATQTFEAEVANRPPEAVGRLPALSLRVSVGVRSVNVSGAFEDPDRDALAYEGSSSDPSVVTVGVSGSTVRVTPLASGTTTVTVTAEDGGGLQAEQVFEVTVANRSPVVVGTLPGLSLASGGTPVPVEVSGAFEDPDGDLLTYGATSAAVTVAAAVVSGTTVTVTPLSRGTATVTVTATDVDGSKTSAEQRFAVTVDGGGGGGGGGGGSSNRGPEAVGTFEDRLLEVGESRALDLSGAFRDRDGDVLTYAAESSSTDVTAVLVAGSVLTVTASSVGESEVTVTATDAAGSNRTATQAFTVTVAYDPDGDGLIGVHTPAQLHAVRHDLEGDGVPTAAGAAGYAAAFGLHDGGSLACAAAGACVGYELGSDLDLDTNGSGGPDAGDAYWYGGAGWLPLGTATSPFATVFEGNGHRIRGLFVRRGDGAGLFGTTGSSAVIRHVGVVAADVTGTTAVGGLVSRNGGLVTGSYATGRVSGSEGIGGLVGTNGGSVGGSYAAMEVSGTKRIGGLVGVNDGDLAAGYATGRVSGANRVGGLVGYNRGVVLAGYATGRVSGAAETGGLVGVTELPGRVTAGYWDTDTSGRSAGGAGRGQSTTALQAPTGYAGLYQAWNVDVDGDGVADAPWHFGTDVQYPALSLDADGDGRSTWQGVGRQLRAGPTVTAVPAVDPVQVALTWTAVDGGEWTPAPAVSYTVYRESDGTVETSAAGVRGLGYVDRDVDSGTAYTYQVAAAVDGGESVRSALVTAELPCAYRVTPLHRDVLWPASTEQVAVATGPSCAWTAASESGFLTVTSGATGKGPGTATVAVAPNAGGQRTGALLVAGHRVTLYQASATEFTDHPLERGVTPVRAIHFLELRARIDALRAGAGLPAFGWTDPTLIPGITPIKAVHVTELRTALAEVYVASGRPAPGYPDTAVAGGTGIRAAHLMELRAAVAAPGT